MGEVAEKLHYRHAHELGPRLAECLDSGGFVAEEDSETHYVSMAALQW